MNIISELGNSASALSMFSQDLSKVSPVAGTAFAQMGVWRQAGQLLRPTDSFCLPAIIDLQRQYQQLVAQLTALPSSQQQTVSNCLDFWAEYQVACLFEQALPGKNRIGNHIAAFGHLQGFWSKWLGECIGTKERPSIENFRKIFVIIHEVCLLSGAMDFLLTIHKLLNKNKCGSFGTFYNIFLQFLKQLK